MYELNYHQKGLAVPVDQSHAKKKRKQRNGLSVLLALLAVGYSCPKFHSENLSFVLLVI